MECGAFEVATLKSKEGEESMRTHLLRLFGGAVLVALVASGGARADNVYGSIRGAVTDPSGALVAGASITATNVATGLSNTATSGANGAYEFPQLPAPASYTVQVSMNGFRTLQARDISLNLNQIYVLNVTLE